MALYDPSPKTVSTDFSLSDVLVWARTKPADEAYCYTDGGHCALALFLIETGRASIPLVSPWTGDLQGYWRELYGERREYDCSLEPALVGNMKPESWVFGKLVDRLEQAMAR